MLSTTTVMNAIPSHERVIKRLIRLLESIQLQLDQPPKNDPNAPPADGQTQTEPKQVPFLISDRPEIRVHPELVAQWQDNQQNDDRYKRRTIFVQWALFWATFAAFVAATIYALIADRTLREIRKQTESSRISAEAARSAAETATRSANLSENLIKGTNAAHLYSDVIPRSLFSVEEIERGIWVRFINDGKVIAKACKVSVSISVHLLPSWRILRSRKETKKRYQLRPSKDNLLVIFQGLITKLDVERLDNNEITVMTERTFSYDNGFGEIIPDSDCSTYFVSPSQKTVRLKALNPGIAGAKLPSMWLLFRINTMQALRH
jgi:hypothetical protein